MIIHDLHVIGIFLPPHEANPPLIVDPDAVLTRATTCEFLEAISRGNPKILKSHGPVQHPQFPQGNLLDILG